MRLGCSLVRKPRRSAPFYCVLVAFALLVLCFVSASDAHSQSATDLPRVRIQTLSPGELANAIDAGPLGSSHLLTLTITLAPADERRAALTQYLTDLQTSNSPNYRKWITPAQFAASYGATADQLAAASVWAQNAGLNLTAISASRSRMTLTGYPAQVEAAFAISLRHYQLNGETYFANATQPTLPAAAAALFTSIEGLDNLPATKEMFGTGPGTGSETLPNQIPTLLSIAAIGSILDEADQPILTLPANIVLAAQTPSRVAAYEALFREAAAEGVTILLSPAVFQHGLLSESPEVTVVASPGYSLELQTPAFSRPVWQSAPGLPADGLRHAPDLAATSVPALASTLATLAQKLPGRRLGNINPILYELASMPELYKQPDDAPAGTWELRTGLGFIDLDKLARAFPLGTGTSFTSFGASSYSPTHGQTLTLTSSVTSGTGGAVPSGTVTFLTGAGVALGTSSLVAGSATFSTNQLVGGSDTVQASYSGDGNYAASSSTAATLFIQPEDSQLNAQVSTGNTFGTPYSVVVTDTAGSGVGIPVGNVTVTYEGPNTNYTQPLTPSTAHRSSATFMIPSVNVGTLTLSINCAGDASFRCNNPYTTTATVAKATPNLSISYSPKPPVSGQAVTLNATVSGVANAAVPSGSVTFYDNATVLNSANLNNGMVVENGVVPSTSSHAITAIYNGDADYNPANSAGSATGGSGQATLAATLSSSSGIPDSIITVAATVTIPGATSSPTGSVVATLTLPDGPSIAVGTLTAAGANTSTGRISVTLPTLPGPYQLLISCPPTDTFTCNNVPFTVTTSASVKIATLTTLTSTPTPPRVGQSLTLTASVNPVTNGTAPLSGSVAFYQGATQIGSGLLINGIASTAITLTGTASLTAVYAGDSNYETSTSAPVTLSATLDPVTVGLRVDGANGIIGSDVTLVATITGPGPAASSPTGKVSFYLAGATPALIGLSTVVPDLPGSATATFLTQSLPAGPGSVYAVYAGDSIFKAGTSPTVSVGLTDYAVLFAPPSLTLSRGQTGTVSLQVNTSAGFTANIALGCTPPPDSLITCSISQTTPSGGGTGVLTIDTVAAATAANRTHDLRVPGGITLAGFIWAFISKRRRRHWAAAWMLLLALPLAAGVSACSTSRSSTLVGSGTPLGTVILTINTAASDGSSGIAHDYTYQVTVVQ